MSEKGSLTRKLRTLFLVLVAVFFVLGLAMIIIGFFIDRPGPSSLREANNIAAGEGIVAFITIVCGIILFISFITSYIKRKKKAEKNLSVIK